MMTYHGPTIPLAGSWSSHCKWHWSSISELCTVCYNKKFETKITLAHKKKSCTRFEVLAVVFQKIKVLWDISRDYNACLWNIRCYDPNGTYEGRSNINRPQLSIFYWNIILQNKKILIFLHSFHLFLCIFASGLGVFLFLHRRMKQDASVATCTQNSWPAHHRRNAAPPSASLRGPNMW